VTSKTPDEVVAELGQEFGEDDGKIVAYLTWRASTLAQQWRTFLYFYCGPIERIQVLNEASGTTARLLQDLLWSNTLLTVRVNGQASDRRRVVGRKEKSLDRTIGQNCKAKRGESDGGT
jgi:hypothetical protein